MLILIMQAPWNGSVLLLCWAMHQCIRNYISFLLLLFTGIEILVISKRSGVHWFHYKIGGIKWLDFNKIERVKHDSYYLFVYTSKLPNPQPAATFSRFPPLAALELTFAYVACLLHLAC